jgi:purine-nucleoside phosphorylase
MSTRKQIENKHWQEQLQAFTSKYKGRTAAIAAQGMTLVENKPFENILYDPYGKETISSWL